MRVYGRLNIPAQIRAELPEMRDQLCRGFFEPFDVLSNIISIPFGQFAIKAQHSAVLKKTVSVSAPIIVMMNSVLNCQKKHLPRQARETNGPLTLLSTKLRRFGHFCRLPKPLILNEVTNCRDSPTRTEN